MKQAVVKIQLAWKEFLASDYRHTRCSAASTIQSHTRGWLLKRRFLNLKQAALKIQSVLRSLRYLKDFHEYCTATKSAIIVQSHVRGCIARRGACQRRICILVIQVSLTEKKLLTEILNSLLPLLVLKFCTNTIYQIKSSACLCLS